MSEAKYLLSRIKASGYTGEQQQTYALLCICQRLLLEVDSAHDAETVKELRRRLGPLNRRLLRAMPKAGAT